MIKNNKCIIHWINHVYHVVYTGECRMYLSFEFEIEDTSLILMTGIEMQSNTSSKYLRSIKDVHTNIRMVKTRMSSRDSPMLVIRLWMMIYEKSRLSSH